MTDRDLLVREMKRLEKEATPKRTPRLGTIADLYLSKIEKRVKETRRFGETRFTPA